MAIRTNLHLDICLVKSAKTICCSVYKILELADFSIGNKKMPVNF